MLLYAGALENPPLLITCDIERIVIRTNWTGYASERHEVLLDELTVPARLAVVKWAFSDPDRLRPATTRQALTEKAAAEFAEIARRLRDRRHEPHAVAHFLARLAFCAFGLFDSAPALPLDADDLAAIQRAAALDWADIDPSLLGTLFERGLDPDKRSQLGAHYTDRDTIERLTNPVIRQPLLAEWEAAKGRIAAALAKAERAKTGSAARRKAEAEARGHYTGFLERLRGFRVLAPRAARGTSSISPCSP